LILILILILILDGFERKMDAWISHGHR